MTQSSQTATRLTPLTTFAWDTETARFAPGCMAPPLVCLTYQVPNATPQLADRHQAHAVLRRALTGAYCLVGHNVPYDLAVMCNEHPDLTPLIFQACAEDRVTDTMVRQWLIDNAAGVFRRKIEHNGRKVALNYTLADVVKRASGRRVQKDAWRTSYGAFRDVPLSGWVEHARTVQAQAKVTLAGLEANPPAKDAPDSAHTEWTDLVQGYRDMIDGAPERIFDYALEDATATLESWTAQEKHARYLKDQYRQVRGYFALHLGSAWGLITDPVSVDEVARKTQAELDELTGDLVAAGLVRANGVRDTKAAAARMVAVTLAAGRKIVRTDAHFVNKKTGAEPKCGGSDDCREHVCLDGDTCEESEDPLLMAYGERTTLAKVLSNDLVALKAGSYYPLHTRYGFAGTGRTTSSKPNIQNQSKREGIRPAFRPRDGYVYVQCDYPQLELYTLAQCCIRWLGKSKLAEVLLAGLDPHTQVAAIRERCSYEDAAARAKEPRFKKARAFGKIANFGFPGGMGATTTVAQARKSATDKAEFDALGFSVAEATKLKGIWFEAYPEMPAYFARINQIIAETGDGTAFVESLFTERFRGGATYCAACNNGFQGLGSDCAKHAAWLIAWDQYTQPDSALWDSRTVAMVHDEFLLEAPLDRASAAGWALADRMRIGANHYLPDVPIAASKMRPAMMRRWFKDADTVTDSQGNLIPWEPPPTP